MSGRPGNPRTTAEFTELLDEAGSLVDISRRLPELPFHAPGGTVRVAQFERLLGTGFVPVLTGLADEHGDTTVTLLVIEPHYSYYEAEYSHLPAIRLDRAEIAERYWEGIAHEPSGDPTGAIAYTGNVIVIFGSTRRWAIWGQRDWGLVLVHSSQSTARWSEAGVPFVSPDVAIGDFTFAASPDVPFSESRVASLLANLRTRSSE